MPDTTLLSHLIAHSANAQGQTQSLESHLRGVAELARAAAEKFGFEEAPALAEWLGWWHDAGKIHPAFQDYISSSAVDEKGPDHSSVGMLHAAHICLPLAFLIAGHHGGLADRDDLKLRIQRKLRDARVLEALEMARSQFPLEVRDVSLPFPMSHEADSVDVSRRITFFLRMLHSTLTDADSLDTERHFNPDKHAERGYRPDLPSLLPALEARILLLQKNAPNSRVNESRHRIYEACLQAASLSPGFFRLTVPTGGGKTLSGMAFALRHALTHGLERVIVVLPYTSIIEQNAKVYRDILGEDAVLEHHSAVTATREGKVENDPDESRAELRRRLTSENWDAPVIVTTGVQFYESLFAARNRRIRKLHRIARSVVILDEVQTLPVHLLEPTLEALRFLVKDYGVSVVLCSATQPALSPTEGFEGIPDAREIVPDFAEHFENLRRVEYHPPKPGESWSVETLAGRVRSHRQVLVVLNTIRDALNVTATLEDTDPFHLSTNLCGDHRRKVLDEVRRRLKKDEPCMLVSTQVVEAGVDLDFPVVYRAVGPLDSIVQAAGRCNREGKLEMGEVFIFRLEGGGLPSGSYETATEATNWIWNENSAAKLDDPAIIERYFRDFYGLEEKDKKRILSLAENQQFDEIARKYCLITEETIPVVVRRYDKNRINALIDALRARWNAAGFLDYKRLRALQSFVVNVRPRTLREMERLNAISSPLDGFQDLRAWDGEYSQRTGLVLHGWTAGDLVL